MSIRRLSGQLAHLAMGQSVGVARADCDKIFPPGLHTTDGRAAMYSLANALGCDVHWNDALGIIHFAKRA